MKKYYCTFCDSRNHHAGDPCPALVGEPVAVVRPPKPKPVGSTPTTFAKSLDMGNKQVQPIEGIVPPTPLPPGIDGEAPQGGHALTQAQRAKRYREKHPDRVREADRERKRMK